MFDLAGLVLSCLSLGYPTQGVRLVSGSPLLDIVKTFADIYLRESSVGDCSSFLGGIVASLAALVTRCHGLDSLVLAVLIKVNAQGFHAGWTYADNGRTARNLLVLVAGMTLSCNVGVEPLAVRLATKVLDISVREVHHVGPCAAMALLWHVFSTEEGTRVCEIWEDVRTLLVTLLRFMVRQPRLLKEIITHVEGLVGLVLAPMPNTSIADGIRQIFHVLHRNGVLRKAFCDPDVLLELADCITSICALFHEADSTVPSSLFQIFYVEMPQHLRMTLEESSTISQDHPVVLHRLVDAICTLDRPTAQWLFTTEFRKLRRAVQPWKEMVSHEWSCCRQAWCYAVSLSVRLRFSL